MRLYLASTSSARLALLRQAGVEPVVIPSQVDEDAALAVFAARQDLPVPALPPAQVVLELARVKALAVADGARDPDTGGPLDGLVLGGDSVFELDGVVHGKPHTADRARERWLAQRGRTGTLWSGQWLVDRRRDAHPDGGTAAGGRGLLPEGLGSVAAAEVTFAADLDDDELAAYIATGEPLQVAGAFTIDSLGGPFIERIAGDPSTVVGLSLPAVRRLTRQLGVDWPSLWTRHARTDIAAD